jgi:hypothetical protein
MSQLSKKLSRQSRYRAGFACALRKGSRGEILHYVLPRSAVAKIAVKYSIRRAIFEPLLQPGERYLPTTWLHSHIFLWRQSQIIIYLLAVGDKSPIWGKNSLGGTTLFCPKKTQCASLARLVSGMFLPVGLCILEAFQPRRLVGNPNSHTAEFR